MQLEFSCNVHAPKFAWSWLFDMSLFMARAIHRANLAVDSTSYQLTFAPVNLLHANDLMLIQRAQFQVHWTCLCTTDVYVAFDCARHLYSWFSSDQYFITATFQARTLGLLCWCQADTVIRSCRSTVLILPHTPTTGNYSICTLHYSAVIVKRGSYITNTDYLAFNLRFWAQIRKYQC